MLVLLFYNMLFLTLANGGNDAETRLRCRVIASQLHLATPYVTEVDEF
jgi:hypothetical protein